MYRLTENNWPPCKSLPILKGRHTIQSDSTRFGCEESDSALYEATNPLSGTLSFPFSPPREVDACATRSVESATGH